MHKLNNDVVYVGQGSRKRFNCISGRCAEHRAVWDKLEKVVVKDKLIRDDALQLENYLVDKYLKEGSILFNKVKVTANILPVTYEYMSTFLEHDLTSSTKLRWKVDMARCARKGQEAGGMGSLGYFKTTVKGMQYSSHRIIYCLLNKVDLDNDKVIDHIDHNRSNNNILNLREVTYEVNCRNRKYSKNNTVGELCIAELLKSQRFRVRWTEKGKRMHKNFSYNPLSRKDNNFAFFDRCIALSAAIKFRDALVQQGLIISIKE